MEVWTLTSLNNNKKVRPSLSDLSLAAIVGHAKHEAGRIFGEDLGQGLELLEARIVNSDVLEKKKKENKKQML